MRKGSLSILFIFVIFLEGIVALIIFFSSPSMEKNSILWGFSLARLIIGFIFLDILFCVGFFLFTGFVYPEKLEKRLINIEKLLLQKYLLLPAVLFLFLLFIACVLYAFIFHFHLPEQFTILYLIHPRVLPLVIWGALILLQLILYFTIVYQNQIRSKKFIQLSYKHFIHWMNHQKIIQPFLILISSVLSLIPNLPKYNPVPTLDSGVFLYFGDQILKGQLPYRDLWDHKPPAIFYTDAFGLWIGNGSRMGIWILELLAILSTGLFAYYFLKKYFGNWSAMFASIIAIENLIFVMDSGNYTEEFALPFQYFALLLFSFAFYRQSSSRFFVLIGVLAGISFMYKQTMIGIWIVLFIMLLLKFFEDKNWLLFLKRILLIATGAGSICLLSVIFFTYHGELSVYWEAAFRFNFIYTQVSSAERIQEFHRIWNRLFVISPYYALGLFSWVFLTGYMLLNRISTQNHRNTNWYLQFIIIASTFIAEGSLIGSLFYKDQIIQFIWVSLLLGGITSAVVHVLQRKHFLKEFYSENKKNLDFGNLLPLQIGIISLPVEILLISISARYYSHYFMGLILPFSILIAFIFWSVAKVENKFVSRICYITLLLSLSFFSGYKISRMYEVQRNDQVTKTVEFIMDHSDDDDFVMIWGTQTRISYLSQRESPTRFVYTIPLYTHGYISEELVDELFVDLISNPPELIVDVKTIRTPFILLTGTGECVFPQSDFDESLKKVFSYICANYHQKEVIGKDEWIVYEHN